MIKPASLIPLRFPLDTLFRSDRFSSPQQLSSTISMKTTKAIENYCLFHNQSFYSFYLLSFAILLSRYSNQQCFTVLLESSRSLDERAAFLIADINITHSHPLLDNIESVKNSLLHSQQVDLEQLSDLLIGDDVQLAHGTLPIFHFADHRSSATFQNIKESFQSAQLASSLIFMDVSAKLSTFDITNDSSLLDEARLKQFSRHYQCLLSSIIKTKNMPVGSIEFLDSEEIFLLTTKWAQAGEADCDYNDISSAFDNIVRTCPQRIAISVYKGERVSYQQLSDRANGIAHYLVSNGVQRGDVVAVAVERSTYWVTSLLGIIKSGAAYLPISLDWPTNRINQILKDAQATAFLIPSHIKATIAKRLQEISSPIIGEEIEYFERLSLSSSQHSLELGPSDLAYVIFTSGTTGKPKGVMITHKGVVSLVREQGIRRRLTEDTILLQCASLIFDQSVFDIWGTLLNAGKLVIIEEEPLSLRRIAEAISGEEVTDVTLIPSLFEQLIELHPDALKRLRYLGLGGERPSVTHLSKMFNIDVDNKIVITNCYGPAENSVNSTYHSVDCRSYDSSTLGTAGLPIGKPFAGRSAYILDEYLHPTAQGSIGVIYVGGSGLALGYLDQPKLTALKFIPHPFAEAPGERLYCTGDLGRHLSDGTIEFLGRADDQVKIRGHRIEPDEIRSIILDLPETLQAVVLATREASANVPTALIAFVVFRADVESPRNAEQAVAHQLEVSLPSFMVPKAIISLPELPTTESGKVSREALLSLAETREREGLDASPQTKIEKELAAIWCMVLGTECISRNSNFYELGGHSLLCMNLHSRIETSFGIEIALKQIFDCPIFLAMAQLIEQKVADHETTQQNESGELEESPRVRSLAPLSFQQEQLWFLTQVPDGDKAHGIPFAIHFHGRLGQDELINATHALVRKHSILHTLFVDVGAQPGQLSCPSNPIHLQVIQLWNYKKEEREVILADTSADIANARWDLTSDLPVRFALIQASEQHIILMVCVHHIAFDGYSKKILIRDLLALIKANGVDCNSTVVSSNQYMDYAIWQRQFTETPRFATQLDYWRQKLSNLPNPVVLPSISSRPEVRSFDGNYTSRKLNTGDSLRLRQFARSQNTTNFVILATILFAFLHKLTGRRDIIIGAAATSRHGSKFDSVIGNFVNTIILRNEIEPQMSLIDALECVRQDMLDALANSDVPFNRIIQESNADLNLKHTPIFQIMITYDNDPTLTGSSETFTFDVVDTPTNYCLYDLVIVLKDDDTNFEIAFNYARNVFSSTMIEQLLDSYVSFASDALDRPHENICFVNMCSCERLRWTEETSRGKAVDYPSDQTVYELFEIQAISRTDDIAIVDGDGAHWSYSKVHERVAALACHLIKVGVRSEVPVAILMSQSAELIIVILAVLKAGGAYIPIDRELPLHRQNTMISEAAAKFVIADPDYSTSHFSDMATVLNVDQLDLDKLVDNSPSEPARRAMSRNTASIIFTSGSTGNPKGVSIPNYCISQLILGSKEIKFKQNDRIAFSSGTSFDILLFEIFGPLLQGVTIAVVPRDVLFDDEALEKHLVEHRITVMFMTPTLLSLKIKARPTVLANLRELWVGGEVLEPGLVAKVKRYHPNLRIINGYGPTEATTFATCNLIHKVDYASRIPVGRPIGSMETYILDDFLQPTPVGIEGEIYIGGDGLANGYVGHPDWTAERFVPSPFPIRNAVGETRIYRTGDRALMRPDGSIDYLGRMDRQVKIMGQRIELSEIEHACSLHDDVLDVAVIGGNVSGGERTLLIAFVVRISEAKLSQDDVLEYLAARLPSIMIPNQVEFLDSLPMTSNGKLDERCLRRLAEERNRPPNNIGRVRHSAVDSEKVIESIWSDILDSASTEYDTNFFEAGGTSVSAMLLRQRLSREFAVVLSIVDVFRYPTIRSMANFLDVGVRGDSSTKAKDIRAARAVGAQALKRRRKRTEEKK